MGDNVATTQWDVPTLLAVIIATGALLVSLATAYWNLWRRVRLSMRVSNDLYISNTLGGVPDVIVSVVFHGSGSPNHIATVQRLLLQLKNETTHKQILLEGLRAERGERLPFLVPGSSTVAKRLMFQTNDYVSDEISRVTDWCDALKTIVEPSKHFSLDNLRGILRKRSLGEGISANDDNEDTTKELSKHEFQNKFANLIEGLPPDKLETVLFVTAGRYTGVLTAQNELGRTLATQKFTFDVDAILSDTLRNQFDTNVRVQLKTQ